MIAAVNAGADAIYMGGGRFGARAYADNPDEERYLEAIDEVHLRGRRLYMTVNTLVKEAEFDQLYSYLNPYYERGLDAVIVQDLGVFSYIRTQFPDLPVHASTQMTITGLHGAKMLADMGASRIVTARELSLEEIAAIRDTVDIEIESFVHGALCYCYSGQCLLSSFIGGRSGNRGRCAQPCRLPFEVRQNGKRLNNRDEAYVLSPKDLCTLDIIPDIIEAGVYSLKIEGRMKSPRYTAGVVSIYRKYVDYYLEHGRTGYIVDPADKAMLSDLFDRGGTSKGYYQQHNGRNMMALTEKPAFREGNQTLFDMLDREYINKKYQEPISGNVSVIQGQPSGLKLTWDTLQVEVSGALAEAAQNQPLTNERLVKQMKKTGNTPFYFNHLEAEIIGDCFMPVQDLNELRRTGLEALINRKLESYRRNPGLAAGDKSAPTASDQTSQIDMAPVPDLHVLLEEPSGLAGILSKSDVKEVYLDATGFGADSWADAVRACHRAGKRCVLALPHIFRQDAEQYFCKQKALLLTAGFDRLLVRSLEEVDFLNVQEIALPLIFDYNMYCMNQMAVQEMKKLGAGTITLPLELNSRELETLRSPGSELIGYGYLPAMISAQCITKTVKGCRHQPELLWLKDRMKKDLPVKNHCRFCYNTIYNPTPLSLLGQSRLVNRLEPAVLRLQFTFETDAQIAAIIDAYAAEFLHGQSLKAPLNDFTRGHFKRGVE
ncbi:MAG: DUF3656 domain-containing U32 family peptidase [Lachnospiraceae bacterium]